MIRTLTPLITLRALKVILSGAADSVRDRGLLPCQNLPSTGLIGFLEGVDNLKILAVFGSSHTCFGSIEMEYSK